MSTQSNYHSDILTNNIRLDYLSVRENFKTGLYTHTSEKSLFFIRFIYIYTGSVTLIYGDGQPFFAAANDMIYLPYGLTYTSHWKGEPDSHYIVIDIALYDRENHVFHFGNTPSILMHDTLSSYPGLFSEISKVNHLENPFFALECLSNVFKLCYEMASVHDSKLNGAKFQNILQGVFYLENNCLSNCSILDLANMCSMSSSNFRRLFYQYKGVSPLKYKNLLRLRKAESLLATGHYSVTQVAEIVRCCDIKHFSKLFKHYLGYTPSSVIPVNTEVGSKRKGEEALHE